MLEHFQHTNNPEAYHSWDRCDHESSRSSATELAGELADYIVRLRCETAPDLYGSWLAKRNGGTHTVPHAGVRLETLIGLGFGRPGKDYSDEHLEGAVAESLWYALIHDFSHEDPIVLALPPGLSPIDHGGDGFVIHEWPGGAVE